MIGFILDINSYAHVQHARIMGPSWFNMYLNQPLSLVFFWGFYSYFFGFIRDSYIIIFLSIIIHAQDVKYTYMHILLDK